MSQAQAIPREFHDGYQAMIRQQWDQFLNSHGLSRLQFHMILTVGHHPGTIDEVCDYFESSRSCRGAFSQSVQPSNESVREAVLSGIAGGWLTTVDKNVQERIKAALAESGCLGALRGSCYVVRGLSSFPKC